MVDNLPGSTVDVLKLKQGSGPTLFGVHGAGGILFFGTFARRLDPDLTFYVIQGKGLDNYDPPFAGLCDLAHAYVEEMIELQPDGDFYICGRWGPVVVEVGQQLFQRGRRVRLAIAFDCVAPQLVPDPAWKNNALLREVRQLYRRLRGHELRAWIRTLRRGGGIRNKPSQVPFVPRALNSRLLSGYVPRAYPGRITLFRSSEFCGRKAKEHHVGTWLALTEDLEVRVVDTTHHTMFHPPDVGVLARMVAEEIARNSDWIGDSPLLAESERAG